VAARDIIVIGASAGGVEALAKLVSSLPPDLHAAVFVTLHIPPWGTTNLPSILSRSGPLPAVLASENEAIVHGRILIAPPDHHLLIAPGHVHLGTGPKENRNRPAINTLFRSAALAYGPRVIGIVLSGTLDDGTVGLWEIKRRGGVAIVQDPKEARFPDMPQNALSNLWVDYTLPLSEISGLLTHWSSPESNPPDPEERMEAMSPQLTNLTCPECRGPLEELRHGPLSEYKCRTGHRYSSDAMLSAHADTEERTLWASVVALAEGAEMAERLANTASPGERKRLIHRAEVCRNLALQVKEVIGTLSDTATVAEVGGDGDHG
jgi:two-component system, chemotaxis family, protein-glutamate methylesterase/glutaminase